MTPEFAFDLLNALIVGLLLGAFYSSVSVGLTIVFGLLEMPQVAHPAFVVLGGYGAVQLAGLGLDPLIGAFVLAPFFYLAGSLLYRFYDATFESRSNDAATGGLIFFFGLAFVTEVALTFAFGSDLQSVDAWYFGKSLQAGFVRIPLRIVLVGVCGALLLGVIGLFLKRTFAGLAIKAVGQDFAALELCGADATRIKRLAVSLSVATAAFAGALLVIVGPIEPFLGRVYLGKAFTIALLAGGGSIAGTLIAGLILGVVESLVLATAGAAWTPAVAFAMLLLVLAVRPMGLFGR